MSDDHQRQLPLPRPNLLSNEYRNGKTRHEKLPKVPSRAIAAKADALRSAVRNGNPLDSAELQERYVDLWHEARLAIWRAKHSKAGIKQHDEITDQDVLTFVVDEKQVLAAIDTTRSVLDSLVKLRRDMGDQFNQLPRWAIEKIESALRHHPAALNALLKQLAAEEVE